MKRTSGLSWRKPSVYDPNNEKAKLLRRGEARFIRFDGLTEKEKGGEKMDNVFPPSFY